MFQIKVRSFGAYAKALSPLIALGMGIVLSSVLACATKGRYYIARTDQMPEPLIVDGRLSAVTLACTVCTETFERPDMAACPFQDDSVCSLCCSQEKDCHDACKKTGSDPVDLGMPVAATAA